MRTLNREPIQPNSAMLDGQKFENMVTAYIEGAPLDQEHEWSHVIQNVGNELKGAALQVKLNKTMIIQGVEFVLYGVLDGLKAGRIYDTKFSKTYKFGKYLDSPQHPMYFEICPEANDFEYVITDGREVFRETYRREEVVPIEREIIQFMSYLDTHNLTDIYCEKWKSKY